MAAADRAEGAKDVIDAAFQNPFRGLLGSALSEGNGAFKAMTGAGSLAMESALKTVQTSFDGPTNPCTIVG